MKLCFELTDSGLPKDSEWLKYENRHLLRDNAGLREGRYSLVVQGTDTVSDVCKRLQEEMRTEQTIRIIRRIGGLWPDIQIGDIMRDIGSNIETFYITTFFRDRLLFRILPNNSFELIERELDRRPKGFFAVWQYKSSSTFYLSYTHAGSVVHDKLMAKHPDALMWSMNMLMKQKRVLPYKDLGVYFTSIYNKPYIPHLFVGVVFKSKLMCSLTALASVALKVNIRKNHYTSESRSLIAETLSESTVSPAITQSILKLLTDSSHPDEYRRSHEAQEEQEARGEREGQNRSPYQNSSQQPEGTTDPNEELETHETCRM